ncbi:MAG TPA: CBS domain-containing protein [Acidimicrobiia bacterium]|jgi:CBS domain-containing protein|nr:CBS domain-containing protein [Acidimicrobiia bacterium]
MKVRDVMTPLVVTASPEMSFKETAELLVEAGVSGLPVVGPGGRLLGLVTEADLMSKEAFDTRRRRPLALLVDHLTGAARWVDKAAGLTAGEVMTTDVVTAAPAEDIRVAARRMLERGVKRLPVVEDGRLVGIVSRYDLLRLFHRPDAAIAAEIDAKLADPLYAPEKHAVQASVEDGVVTLAGRVRLEGEEALVHGLAERVPGVVRVIDRVRFDEPISRRR